MLAFCRGSPPSWFSNSENPTTQVSGLFSSCATPATNSPMTESFCPDSTPFEKQEKVKALVDVLPMGPRLREYLVQPSSSTKTHNRVIWDRREVVGLRTRGILARLTGDHPFEHIYKAGERLDAVDLGGGDERGDAGPALTSKNFRLACAQ